MSSLHRKLLQKFVVVCISSGPLHDSVCKPLPLPPPPPPPPPPSIDHSFPPYLIAMFGFLAFSIFFICYTCATRLLTRRTNHHNTNEPTFENRVNEDHGPVIYNPFWLINTRGLDQSQIESIQIFKYKQDEKLIDGTDCSVCLSEFEEDESLRLLPKCSHAFHVTCIDTWLRSHMNCPLCRAPIIKNTNDQTQHTMTQLNSTESSSTSVETETETETETQVNDSPSETSGVVDERNTRGEGLVVMRRSFSNGQLVALKKSRSVSKRENKLKESFGRSLRKASSFTSKSSPYNRSY